MQNRNTHTPWDFRRLGFILTVAALCAAGTWTVSSAEPKLGEAKPQAAEGAAGEAKGLELFREQVRPLLVQHCVKCHGKDEDDLEGEFDLADRQGLMRGGATGPAIIAGNAKDSLLYKLITHSKKPHMPHEADKLPDDAIARIAAWIDLGAPYDKPLVAGKSSVPAWTQKTLSADARQFWSYQPLRRVEPPAVGNAGWCRTPVDQFILAKLEVAGWQPNPTVTKRQLVRRVYFDLIGLPPKPEDVEMFVSDSSPDAYGKLIDRLLDSPHYGERWARHWLDLARFAESHGFEHDTDRPTAYHYRDFVIQALNAGLPYDTFVKWQIAGDEFAPENNLALMATGFLAAGVHSTQITKNEVEKHRYDEMDDMLATIGTSMLGLTIGCARCHDHKFDAIPQSDYYRLLSTFTTTVRSEVELNLDPEGYKVAKAAFDKEHAPFAEALKKFEDEQIASRLAAWEKTWPTERENFKWVLLDIASHKSKGGATLTKQEDGSVLASGTNPKVETFTFEAQTDRKGITAIRLEALSHPSFVKGGPGRATNGNFALTDFSVTAKPLSGDPKGSAGAAKPQANATPVKIRLRNARGTFEQSGLPVAAAIDDSSTTAWAVDPQFGKDHAAVFETEGEVGFEGGTTLTFTLQFQNNVGHSIGRPRLSITTATAPVEIAGNALSQKVLEILETPAEKRSAEQIAALSKWYRPLDSEWRKFNQTVQDRLFTAPKPNLVKAMISSEGLPPVRLNSQGADFLNETHFLRRGDTGLKDGVAPQGFLQVLMTAADREKHWPAQPPAGWRTSYRRRALAEWLTDVENGAGHLLARVIVNRLWQQHLGRGIVATPSDFGTRGERPTHPELLDWLATELIRHKWQLKPIHKLILSSALYAQSSQFDEAKAGVDSDNKLVWRRPRRRLEAEVIRDSLLAVSGTLDPAMHGPGTLDPNSKRRSIYFTIKRSQLLPMMQVFDCPDGLSGIGERPTTTIAPQALLLLNNANIRASAKYFAQRIAPDVNTPLENAIRSAYLSAVARPPNDAELADAISFVNQQAESYKMTGKESARELALADFCQALMCLNEFVYVD